MTQYLDLQAILIQAYLDGRIDHEAYWCATEELDRIAQARMLRYWS